MFGLMILGATALYLALMFFVVRWAWRKGRANDGSLIKASTFAVAGFLVVYLPVFWNHIPIVLAHRSMCAKDAGLKVHKSAKQWISENRDRLGSLQGIDLDKPTSSRQLANGVARTEYFSGLLASESKTEQQLLYGVPLHRIEFRVIDVVTNEVLTTDVNYQVGTREDIRLWLAGQSCYEQGDKQSPWNQAIKFNEQLKEGVK
jgi:hypothetical protein